MEVFGLIVSFIALSLALFTYIKHDIKLKKQSAQLNDYHLEKIEVEREERLKAIIEASSKDSGKGRKIIKIFNRGKSIAKDVKVIIPEVGGFTLGDNPSPIDILPQHEINITLFLFNNHPDKLTIEFMWSDDYKSENRESQTIQL
ncbi:MAG: hypothetical protein AB7E36_09745 [Salinivirgaceae bacterium]